MQIHSVSFSRGFLFFTSPHLKVETSEGVGTCYLRSVAPDVLDVLNKRLQGFVFETKEDFQKLFDLVGEVDVTVYLALEAAILDIFPGKLSLFGSAKSMPRPITSVLKKSSGIPEFFVLSLEANDFSKAVLANELVVHHFQKRKFIADVPDDLVFQALQEILNEVHLHFDFPLHLGVRLTGCSFSEKTVVDLVKKHSLVYILDPLPFSDKEGYQRLVSTLTNDCFLGVSAVTYFNPLTPESFVSVMEPQLVNSVLLSWKPYVQMAPLLLAARELNTFVEGRVGIAPFVVGLGIPMIHLSLEHKKEYHAIVSSFEKISTSLKKI